MARPHTRGSFSGFWVYWMMRLIFDRVWPRGLDARERIARAFLAYCRVRISEPDRLQLMQVLTSDRPQPRTATLEVLSLIAGAEAETLEKRFKRLQRFIRREGPKGSRCLLR
jgi:hypothetical protein